MKRLCIAIAAGGTGGHVFPAISLAEILIKRGHKVIVLTDRRGDFFDEDVSQWLVYRIRCQSPSQTSIFSRIYAVGQLFLGFFDARRALKEQLAEVIVGFGGYPSVPPLLAASNLNIPIVLHEQNAVLGRANKWLIGRASAIATSFEHTKNLAYGDRVTWTGNPVRTEILKSRSSLYPFPTSRQPFSLSIFGGSLGATIFSTVIPEAINLLPSDLRDSLIIHQQCRPQDLEKVKNAYSDLKFEADLQAFFQDIPAQLRSANLVIARAGATTVGELAAIGRPSILVPYPFAMDDHQTENARAFERAGASWVIAQSHFTPAKLAEFLLVLFREPNRLKKAAGLARDFSIPDAAERLADLVVKVANSDKGKNIENCGVMGRKFRSNLSERVLTS